MFDFDNYFGINRPNLDLDFGPVDTKEIVSFNEYIQETSKLRNLNNKDNQKILYRGQKEDWPLIPTIGRDKRSNAYSEVKEKNELKKFIQESDSNPKYNDLEWLTLAQHHDVPTRLLDWTEDPFVALWFACNGKKINNDSSRIVWGFLINLNELPDINFEKPLELKKMAVFKHNPIDKRMIAQNAWFTVHYFDDDFKWCDALENEKQVKKKLFKFKLTISETLRNEFLKELDKMGITLL